eukprot:scaffold2.g7270.t1
MTVTQAPPQSVFQLAKALPQCAAFHRIYSFHQGFPRCRGTPELEAKYGVAQQNKQHVMSITNLVSLTQCWYNEARSSKPQTFSAPTSPADPTIGRGCDFCDWQALTAADTWGRVERPHAVSASNLFKYVAPAQGVVLFKHHNPLEFSMEQLGDLLGVAHGWFEAAAEAAVAEGQAPAELHPLLVWNCLARAGASQYHGHAQVMLSGAPFPEQARAAAAAARYAAQHGRPYLPDLHAVHEAAGLLWRVHSSAPGDTAHALPSLAPVKAGGLPGRDCELVVRGSHLLSPAFQLALFACLRALIDELGVRTFNAAISFDPAPAGGAHTANGGGGGGGVVSGPCTARLVSRGKLGSAASDYGGLEVFGGASIAHTDPYAVGAALERVLARLGAGGRAVVA